MDGRSKDSLTSIIPRTRPDFGERRSSVILCKNYLRCLPYNPLQIIPEARIFPEPMDSQTNDQAPDQSTPGGDHDHAMSGNGNGNGAGHHTSAPDPTPAESVVLDDAGLHEIPAVISMPVPITNTKHDKPLADVKIPDPKNPRQWLRQFFETEEGRKLILDRVKGSDTVLLHCVDRAYGKVKEVMDVTHRSALAHKSEEELRAIVNVSP